MHADDDSDARRRSVWYDLQRAAQADAELRRLLDWSSLTYPHRLIEDVTNRVFPYRGYGGQATSVKMEPHDAEVERLVASALGGRWDLADGLYKFGRECLSNVVLFGEDAYEIVYDEQTEVLGSRRFSLVRIPPHALKRRDGQVSVQRVPAQIARELHVPREIDLPENRLVVFEPPGRVRKQLPRMLERLAALSDGSVPGFAIDKFRLGAKLVPFDVKAFSRAKDLAVAAATRDIGWSGRVIFFYGEQRVVEHYWWYREFAFERFLIELRDAFLSVLNQGLRHVGAKCGFKGQIRFEGFPTLRDVNEAQRSLFVGHRSLAETNAAFRAG